MRAILRSVDLIVLVLIALIAAVLSVLDFFNLVEVQALSYPLFNLFLVSMIGLHLIVRHFADEDFQGQAISLLTRVAARIGSTEYRQFADSSEMETYLGKRLLEAKRSVCDLTWKAKMSEGFSATGRQLSHDYMDRCISEASSRISYREIFVFNDNRRIAKLERRLAEYRSGYSCRYFPQDSSIPRLQFVILDDEEVLFFASSADSPLACLRSPELGRIMKSYFEAAWAAATPIKTGPAIQHAEVERIRNLRQGEVE